MNPFLRAKDKTKWSKPGLMFIWRIKVLHWTKMRTNGQPERHVSFLSSVFFPFYGRFCLSFLYTSLLTNCKISLTKVIRYVSRIENRHSWSPSNTQGPLGINLKISLNEKILLMKVGGHSQRLLNAFFTVFRSPITSIALGNFWMVPCQIWFIGNNNPLWFILQQFCRLTHLGKGGKENYWITPRGKLSKIQRVQFSKIYGVQFSNFLLLNS